MFLLSVPNITGVVGGAIFCHQSASLTTFSATHGERPQGRMLQKIVRKHQWQALFDNVSYLVTYGESNALLFFLPLYPPRPPLGALYWQPQYDSQTIYFSVLILHLLWIIQVCCRKCHRSAPYEITMRFAASSLSASFLSVSLSLSLWCRRWKKHEGINLFCFCAWKERRFFTEYLFPLCVGGNNSCYVSNKW